MSRPDLAQRVAVTGIGVVSSLGIGREAFWSALAEGRSGIGPVTLFDLEKMRPKLGGEIRGFDAKTILGPVKGLRLLDRTTLLALGASKLALEDAGYEVGDGNAVGCALGSTMGSFTSRSEFFREALEQGPRAVNPALFPNTVVNSPASQVAIKLGLRGFNTTISSGFASSLEAIEYAARLVSDGRCRAALAGGAEELSEAGYWCLHQAGLLAGSREGALEQSLPFDRRRNGCVLGEGAVMLLLEPLELAVRRSAPVWAEYRGGAGTTDRSAFNRYALAGRGSRRAIRLALERGRVPPCDIGCVAAGANGHLIGDAAEGRALQEELRPQGPPLMASAVKSMLGETLSAAGAFQTAQAVFSLCRGIVSPTINVDQPDSRCLIDCVANKAREARLEHVLVHTTSPMCQSAAAVVSRFTA